MNQQKEKLVYRFAVNFIKMYGLRFMNKNDSVIPISRNNYYIIFMAIFKDVRGFQFYLREKHNAHDIIYLLSNF